VHFIVTKFSTVDNILMVDRNTIVSGFTQAYIIYIQVVYSTKQFFRGFDLRLAHAAALGHGGAIQLLFLMEIYDFFCCCLAEQHDKLFYKVKNNRWCSYQSKDEPENMETSAPNEQNFLER
jgi:hypothetical protein